MSEKPTYDELQNRLNRFHSLLSNISGMIYRGKPDWSTEIITQSKQISGYSSSEFNSGKINWMDIIHPDDKNRVLQESIQMPDQPVSLSQEYQIITKGGNIRWVLDKKTALFSDADQFCGVDGIVIDITKQKQLEQKLSESETKFRAIFTNVTDGILVGNASTKKFTMANNTICKMLGYTKEELLTLAVEDIHPEDELPKVIDTFERQARKEFRIAEDLPVRRKDGTVFYADISSSPIAIGNETFLVGIFRDITERKEVEEALIRNEQRYKSAQRMGQVGNWEYDILTENFWGSDEAKRIYGFDPKSQNFTTDQVESCIPDRDKVHQALIDLIENEKPYDLEFEIFPINQSEKKIIKSIAEVVKDVSGKSQKVTGVVQDITDQRSVDEKLRKSEQKYRRLTENSPDMIYRMSLPEGRYEYVNPAAEHIFGYPPKAWYDTPLLIRDLLSPEFHLYFRREWENILNGHVSPTYEYKIIHIDKRERWVNQRNILVKDHNGLPIAIEAVVTDISEQKQANEALQESEQKFRILFESSKDANYISTIEGDIIDVNQSFLELFDYDRTELHGLRTQDLYVNSQDRSAFISEVERVGFTKDFEEKLRDKNGKMIECHTNATFRRSVDGTIIGYQGIIRDVTDIKRKQKEREELIHELQEALAEVKTLSGLLPICSHCKKIRDDKGYWKQIEDYLLDHSDATFSHGICQECAKKYYPDMDLYEE